MKTTMTRWGVVPAVVALVGLTSILEAALVRRVAPFEGRVFEGFEMAQYGPLTNMMGGLASFGGSDLTVQNGNFFNLWDQHAFEDSNFLGASAGYGTLATIEITFLVPVKAFGGLFGHRVHPLIETAGDTEFVFYDARNREIGRDRIFIGSLPGGVPGYWRFTRGVKRITQTYVHPMADALTAQLTAANYHRLQRAIHPRAR